MNPVYEITTVTPKMAARWLDENNTNNRPLFEKTIEKYAREMTAGAWTLTNQGIGFADDGTLLDGQQRLSAIVMANIPVKMLVVKGMPRIYRNNGDGPLFTQDVIDGQKPRTTPDALAISHGVENANMKMAIVNMIVHAFRGNVKLSPRIAVKILDLYSDEIEFTLTNRTQTRGLSFTPAIAAIVLAAKVDLDNVMAFKDQYFKGTDLKEGSPALTFRNFMLTRSASTVNNGSIRMTVLNYAFTSIKYHIDGKPLRRLVSNDKAREYFMSKQKSCVNMVNEWVSL